MLRTPRRAPTARIRSSCSAYFNSVSHSGTDRLRSRVLAALPGRRGDSTKAVSPAQLRYAYRNDCLGDIVPRSTARCPSTRTPALPRGPTCVPGRRTARLRERRRAVPVAARHLAAAQAAVVPRMGERTLQVLERLTPRTLNPRDLPEEQQSLGGACGISCKCERRLGDRPCAPRVTRGEQCSRSPNSRLIASLDSSDGVRPKAAPPRSVSSRA